MSALRATAKDLETVRIQPLQSFSSQSIMMILHWFSVTCLPHVIDVLNVFRVSYSDAADELLVNYDDYISSSSNTERGLKAWLRFSLQDPGEFFDSSWCVLIMPQIRNNTGLRWQSTDGEGQEFMKRQYVSNKRDKEQCYWVWQIADNDLWVFLQGLSFIVFCQHDKLIINDEEISHCDGRVGVFEASKLSSASRQVSDDVHQDAEQLKKFVEWIIIHSQCCVWQCELMRVTRVRAIEQKTYWQSKQGYQDHEWLLSTFLSPQNWRPISLPEHDHCVANCP